MGPQTPPERSPGRGRAVTLVEMIVVVAIIVLILAAVLPSLSSTWQQRKAADTETTVRGALATARMQALNNKERGLFFMLDPDTDEQKIYTIEAEPFDPVTEAGVIDEQSAANRFKVLAGKVVTLSKPFRVTPRSVVDKEDSSSWVWSNGELTNQDYRSGSQTTLERHRNFFTIVFSPDGQLRVGRHVLIHDPDGDASGNPGHGLGDRTGLKVNTSPTGATQWYEGTDTQTLSTGLPQVIDELGGWAINFASVDGLLVYDDSALEGPLTADEQRDYLLASSVPLYISRLSGAVVRGPRGENE